jgi:hypothetical protein
MKKNKTVAFIFGALMLALSACKKDSLPSAFWTDGNKFEFQGSTYFFVNGADVEFIVLGNWDSENPNIARAKIYKGKTGGQVSFSVPVPQENYTVITDSVELEGIYLDNSMLFSNMGIEVLVVSSGGFYAAANYSNDVRKIEQLVISGKKYNPYPFNYGIAFPNTSGVRINRMIQRDKVCSFNTCVSGVSQEVSWVIDANDRISISGEFGNISGYIYQSTKFSTPLLIADDGRVYLLQMFTPSVRNDVVCLCTERFKLYLLSNYKTTNPVASLILGDC